MATPYNGPQLILPARAELPGYAPNAHTYNPNGGLDQFFSTPTTTTTIPRIAVSLDGLDKTGKNHWAFMTAPTPLVCISQDTGTEMIAKKAVAAGRDVKVMYIDAPDPDPTITRADQVNRDEQKVCQREWERVRTVGKMLSQDKKIRTVVFDTGEAVWNLCLMAHFGKTTKIAQHLRTQPNAEYNKFLWDLYEERKDLNIIMIHRLKKLYLPNAKGEGEWTGGYERRGQNQVGFFVDISLRTGWDPNFRKFYTEVDSSQPTRWGGNLCGARFYDERNTFWNLGFELFPETELTPGVWGL